MSFNYFTKEHAKQQLFFKTPKALMYHSKYKSLSSNAKLIYSFMLDRLNLSIDNDWCDNLNNYYIVCEVDEVELLLSCSRKTAIKVIKELETFELIKKAKSGNGNSNILYIADYNLNIVVEQGFTYISDCFTMYNGNWYLHCEIDGEKVYLDENMEMCEVEIEEE